MTPRSYLCSLLAFSLLAAHCSPAPSAVDGALNTTDAPSVGTDSAVVVEDAPVVADAALERDPLVVARPFRVRVPEMLDPTQPIPLVLLLHGYGVTGAIQDSYFGLGNLVSTRNFALATPDGTLDASGKRFWNATEVCCNFNRIMVDDVAYLRAVLTDVRRRYNIDPNKIFVVGHSNGGFMTLQLACELSDQISAVISLAGSDRQDVMRCQPARAVNVLAVHGTADPTIPYAGAMAGGVALYPGAEALVGRWATRNGCTGMRAPNGAALDVDTGLPGAETIRSAHSMCRPGGSAELWRIENGGHAPALAPEWGTMVIDWLMAHGR